MIRGLYIHIPFCSIKCPYCDFTSITLLDEDIHRKYFQLLKKELLLYKDEDFSFETVYFGGGTPSVVDTELIRDFLDFIKENLPVSKDMEITIEVNPNTYRYREFLAIKEAGINRVSFGVQSFLEKNLKILGRDHTPEDSYIAIYDAKKAGFENISLDMIYGIYRQTLKDLEKDLKIYTSLPVKHISAYMLTAYEGTPLGQLVKDGKYSLPEEELVEDMFFLINETLGTKGFKRYEISNWAKEGFICKHNYFYWNHTPFLGIGVSAWSFIKEKRFGNTKNLQEYMKKLEEEKKPVLFEEKLSKEDIQKEKVILGLRTTEGIDEKYIRNKEVLNELLKEGFLKKTGKKISLSNRGILVANYIINKLI